MENIDINIPYKGIVTKKIHSGFELNLNINNGIYPGFLPNSISGANKMTENQSKELVGKEIDVMLEVYNDKALNEGGTYVVNRRKYLQLFVIPKAVEKLKGRFQSDNDSINNNIIKEPTKYKGVIINVLGYGTFIEFGDSLTGLLHKDNYSDEIINNPDLLKIDNEIEFYVKEFSFYNKTKETKIILTQNQKVYLWDRLISKNKKMKGKYFTGVYTGKIDKISHSGILVRFDEDTLGMIQPINIIDKDREYKIGEEVQVRIIGVFKDTRKIYLKFYEEEKKEAEI